MALAHKTIINSLTIDRSGLASVQIGLLIADGDTDVSDPKYHRIPIAKGTNLAGLRNQINAILTEMGKAPLSVKDANVVGQTLTACWAAMDA